MNIFKIILAAITLICLNARAESSANDKLNNGVIYTAGTASIEYLLKAHKVIPYGIEQSTAGASLSSIATFRIVLAMQLAAAGYTGVQVGRMINELDEKYTDGVITHNNIVAESIGRGLEAARVFESYDYVTKGNFTDDVLWQLTSAVNSLKKPQRNKN